MKIDIKLKKELVAPKWPNVINGCIPMIVEGVVGSCSGEKGICMIVGPRMNRDEPNVHAMVAWFEKCNVIAHSDVDYLFKNYSFVRYLQTGETITIEGGE